MKLHQTIQFLSLKLMESEKENTHLKKVISQKEEENKAWNEHLRKIIKRQNEELRNQKDMLDARNGQIKIKF